MSGPAPEQARWPWIALLVGTALVGALGVAALVLVPVGRPDGWLPPQSRAVYLAHAVLGAAVVLGGLAVLRGAARAGRIVRLGATVGLAGLALGAGGGMLAAFHPWRLTGMGLMLAGMFIAWFGYLLPLLDRVPDEDPIGRQAAGAGPRPHPAQARSHERPLSD